MFRSRVGRLTSDSILVAGADTGIVLIGIDVLCEFDPEATGIPLDAIGVIFLGP